MVLSSRLQNAKNSFTFEKCYFLKDRISYSYKKFRNKLSSELSDSKVTPIKRIFDKNLRLFYDSNLFFYIVRPKNILRKLLAPSRMFFFNVPKRKIDWNRARFNGEVVSIIAKDGVISQKVFLTPQGNLIVVNRNELGVLVRAGFFYC